MILLGDILNLCLDSICCIYQVELNGGCLISAFDLVWVTFRISVICYPLELKKKGHIFCELFLKYFKDCDLMPTRYLILFNHAEKMYQHHTVIAYLQTSVWYTSQLVDRDKGQGPLSQGNWLTVIHFKSLFSFFAGNLFSIFHIFILFVHQKQWSEKNVKMPLKLKKMFGKPFKKLFHRHCVKKTITSVDEEDTVDERTIERVRRKLTCKKVGITRIKHCWLFQNALKTFIFNLKYQYSTLILFWVV